MGAGGSTAVSCSSLDLQNQREKYLSRHQQHQLHEQRMLKYRKQQVADLASSAAAAASSRKSAANMKHSSSYFDLTTSNHHLLLEQQQLQSPHSGQTKANWMIPDAIQPDAYSISNANIGVARPIMVLPKDKSPISPNFHYPYHHNHNPQAHHSNHLVKKSNAGVANRIMQQQLHKRSGDLKKFSDSLPSLNNLTDFNGHQFSNKPTDYHHHHPHNYQHHHHHHHTQHQYNLQVTQNLSAKQRQQQVLLKQQKANKSHLVIGASKYDETSNQNCWQNATNSSVEQTDPQSCLSIQQMKRATSLSSLHNLHNHHAATNNYQQQHVVTNNNSKHHDLKQPNLLYDEHNIQQKHYNQPTALAKKIMKFKQVVQTGNAAASQSSKKYKHKQKQQQQAQQGCQVLPPLPRSQSLHELIQLRATENGQRMRTTGTLRGPLGGNENGNKVNLVVELLENRRQQKLSGQQQVELERNSATLLSTQSSSSDDGIHDVSLNGEQQSASIADDSRFQQPIEDANDHRQHLKQSSSQQEQKQRIYKRNSQQPTSQKRFTNNNNNQQQVVNQQLVKKPTSERVENDDDDDDDDADLMSSHHNGVKKKLENRSVNNNKSTLRRSSSHSAIHTSNLNKHHYDNDQNDADESDDLNELAKFLYQFKQRQAASKQAINSTVINHQSVNNNNTKFNGVAVLNSKNKNFVSEKSNSSSSSTSSSSSSSSSNNSNNKTQVAPNFQQSPNSTTSSSGFASSTCNSNSISSSKSEETERGLQNRLLSSEVSKKLSKKKYPAPQRPQSQEHKSTSKLSIFNNNNHTKDQDGCLISGKLKLSSSLLSIVDEYNSSLHSKSDYLPSSPALSGNAGDPILTSVLLGKDNTNNHSLVVDRAANSSKKSANSPIPCRQIQHCQLERLRRYTQLRQMSQSELALNHLASSSSSSSRVQQPLAGHSRKLAKRDCNEQQQRNGKPYKSKLINIIRRISDTTGDKTEVTHHSAANQIATGSCAVGGHQMRKNCQHQLVDRGERAINQADEMIVPCYSNQFNFEQQQQQNLDKKCLFDGGLRKESSTCLSESLYDLNFDCDFELLKNCGLPKRDHNQRQTAASLSTDSANLNFSSSADRHFACNGQQQGKVQRAINSSKQGENNNNNNNWRLAPTSYSLEKPSLYYGSSECESYVKGGGGVAAAADKGKVKGKDKVNLLQIEKSCCDVRRADLPANSKPTINKTTTTTCNNNSNRPTKLKWSASGWLMNSSATSNAEKSKSTTTSNGKLKDPSSSKCKKPSQEDKQHQLNGIQEGNLGKSCLSKLISNSRIPLSMALNAGCDSANEVDSFDHHRHVNGCYGGSCACKVAESTADSRKSKCKCNSKGKGKSKIVESVEGSSSELARNLARVNSEANQLLDELDHSLDLVSSSDRAYNRKTSIDWWKVRDDNLVSPTYASTQHIKRKINKGAACSVVRETGTLGSSDDDDDDDYCEHEHEDDDYDEDDDDEDAYTSFNRAMINATFNVNLNQTTTESSKLNLNYQQQLSIQQPGSPSNSFTFSVANSPVAPTDATATTTANNTKLLSASTTKQSKSLEADKDASASSEQQQQQQQHQLPLILHSSSGATHDANDAKKQTTYTRIQNSADATRSNHVISAIKLSTSGSTLQELCSLCRSCQERQQFSSCNGVGGNSTSHSHPHDDSDSGKLIQPINGHLRQREAEDCELRVVDKNNSSRLINHNDSVTIVDKNDKKNQGLCAKNINLKQNYCSKNSINYLLSERYLSARSSQQLNSSDKAKTKMINCDRKVAAVTTGLPVLHTKCLKPHTTDLLSVSNSQLNVDFDDNFILKRKTPNAGLKSHC